MRVLQAISPRLRAIGVNLNSTQERLEVSFAKVNRWEGVTNTRQNAARYTITALAAEAEVNMAEGGLRQTPATPPRLIMKRIARSSAGTALPQYRDLRPSAACGGAANGLPLRLCPRAVQSVCASPVRVQQCSSSVMARSPLREAQRRSVKAWELGPGDQRLNGQV